MDNKQQSKVLKLVIYALSIAIVFVTTYMIQIPMPFSEGGLVHIGDIALFTFALVFGKKLGAVAGGFGMALFDLSTPYSAWAPYTFIIRFSMGFIIGYIAHMNSKEGKNLFYNVMGLLTSLPILLGGYYIAEGIMTSNWIAPVNSIPGNLGQFAVGLLGAIPLSMALNSIKSRSLFNAKKAVR